jgi:dTDP-4-amino-4,6-dideoxygalactose transaminase
MTDRSWCLSKLAENEGLYLRPFHPAGSAREAIRYFLESVSPRKATSKLSVLLPAYVGWSPREGSGLLDPVRAVGAKVDFYAVSDRLEVDVSQVCDLLGSERPDVLILVHYFGRPEPNTLEIADHARSVGTLVLEDEAHALLSDIVAGVAGRAGEVSAVSLHKLFPVPSGGGLLVNRTGPWSQTTARATIPQRSPWEFDLVAIAQARRRNAQTWLSLLDGLEDVVAPLWGEEAWGAAVPQTLPVLLQEADRDRVYEALNQVGIGAVSLYHTLVPEITAGRFPASHRLSRTILNLPVHQDLNEEDVRSSFPTFMRVVRENGKSESLYR